MTITVRLLRAQQAALARLTKTRGQTKSDVVRDAIELLLEREAAEREPMGSHETVAHLIGCANSGKEVLSESTGRRFAALMKERARSQRRHR